MKKKILTSLFVLMLSLFVAVQASAANNTTRLGGQDRFDVSINVSKEGWSTANTVVLANWDAFGDALAAGPLAYKNNGPLLLTKADSLTPRTKKEIQRLKAKNVIIVGGPISVSENIVKELRGMNISVKRISGNSRMEVANNIAKEMGKASRVVIADGFNFPDALSIAPWAARNGYPILLTNNKHNLESSTLNLIKSWNVTQTVISGGPLSVSDQVYKSVPNPKRYGGNSRYEVSANIANAYFKNSSQAFVTNGQVFADALTGSVLAAKKNAPMLLIQPNNITGTVQNSIINNGYSKFTILGGPVSVSNNIQNKLNGDLVGQTIVVDPGHGGKDPGAVGNSLAEKEIVLDVSKRVNSKLKDSLAKVVMTRNTDTFVELPDRVKEGEKANADLFVSIHVNSFTDPSANGTETYYNSQYVGAESKALAQEIQKELVKAMKTNDRGVKEAGFYVIKNSKMPSVLVEIAFISNTNDAKKLASASYRQKAADAIYTGIVNYYK
ncbi:N-acetylmuramoyl-L-alanine amidase [Cytobacillus horneckiae]|uniref:N-acetylmuramoyl-L-alanine amidase n=1 Tax=Cytobacillus horneckiae TaxID=549687 RepID=UPI0019D140FE|nr:N-acetylmuramoyl-L-alanine amidase [Cytobacillus horneckiae]MBN6885250.1 N-acetylmuramoyl-L-alanine amidase [Cytobacillus horneckiae]